MMKIIMLEIAGRKPSRFPRKQSHWVGSVAAHQSIVYVTNVSP